MLYEVNIIEFTVHSRRR
jgi:hypothetical protein